MDVVIGLEVHVQLGSQSKIFCSCPTTFGAAPNSQICPVCAGHPGTLPVLNKKVFDLAVRAVVALGGEVSKRVKFDRKNYFYPDLPKGYQISQYDMPVGKGGGVEIELESGKKFVNLTRLHLEEDAGKLIHDKERGASYVDFNRAGMPLAEIVSEPEIKSPDEAYAYLVNLKAILKAVGVSEVNMEMGHLRCDANVSVRKSPSDPFGTKVEIKNLNSFKYVRSALEYEIKRQTQLVEAGERIVQETRLWDDPSQRTISMRLKEQAHDYRYFPDPDLVPFEVSAGEIEEVRRTLPELPKAKRARFKETYGLSDYDTALILGDDALLELFNELSAGYKNYKNLANWILGPLSAYMNENRLAAEELKFDRKLFLDLIKAVDEGVVSLKASREIVFPEFMKTGAAPRQIVADKQLGQISDSGVIEKAIDEALAANQKVVADFMSGKDAALQFLVGQVMRASKGKANPNMVSDLIRKKLKP